MLVNPNLPDAGSQWKDVQEAARMIGQQVHVVHAGSEGDFSRAFATLVQLHAGALLVGLDVLFISRRNQLVALAARHAIPTIYPVCTENPIRVYRMIESAKLARWSR
jgi:putative ABC transport system substrate-binding protein